MATVTLFPNEVVGEIKPMNCVNNGPVRARSDQAMGNFADYKSARFPYMRTHDASFCASYGGEHSVDVNMIFSNFDSDVDDPDAYDFTLTDEYLRNTLDAGTQIFYRLGSKIEHWIKKYNTKPPKDYLKWAKICEHIIRHYNEGWNNGFHWNIQYWEIWNEADNSHNADDYSKCACWGGSTEEFFKFYRTVACHLKSCFPNLKIGGPAVAWNLDDWAVLFLDSMAAEPRVPLDFFSWHCYGTDVQVFLKKCQQVRDMLDAHGYVNTESIQNEYNYVKHWGADWMDSIQKELSIKGAAFSLGYMLGGQDAKVDMLMYYDARPCAMNGIFAPYTFARLKGYYAFRYFSKLYQYGTQVRCVSDDKDIYAVAARNADGKLAMVVCYYADDDNQLSRQVVLEGCERFKGKVMMVDINRTNDDLYFDAVDGKYTIRMKLNSFMLLTEE